LKLFLLYFVIFLTKPLKKQAITNNYNSSFLKVSLNFTQALRVGNSKNRHFTPNFAFYQQKNQIQRIASLKASPS